MATEEHTAYQDIGIEDVDFAIEGWFDRIVDAYVETPTDELKKVPVVFASGERWATGRSNKGIRDKNGLLILPIISIRRTGIDRDRTRLALGSEKKTLTIARRVDGKTNIVQNAINSRTLPNRGRTGKIVHRVTTIPFPDWCVSTYEIVIQTQYIVQMNRILEKIFHTFDLQNQFVMPIVESKFEQSPRDETFEDRKPLEGYYFVGLVDTTLDDTGNFEEFTDSERIVKYSFNVTVPTYFQLDPEGTRPSIQTQETAFVVKFSDEHVRFVDSEEEFDAIFSFKRPLSLPS